MIKIRFYLILYFIKFQGKNTEVSMEYSLLKEIPIAQSSIKDITFFNLRKKNQYIAETLSKIKENIQSIESLQNPSGSSNLVSMDIDISKQSLQISKTKPVYCKNNSINKVILL